MAENESNEQGEEVKDEAPVNIFREEALEKLASPEQLDQLLIVTNRKMWISMLTIGVFLLLLGVWSVFGSIAIPIQGKTILVSQGGLIDIQTLRSGTVSRVNSFEGDIVSEGQVLAVVTNQELELKGDVIDKKIERQRKFLGDEINRIQREKTSLMKSLEEQLALAESQLQDNKSDVLSRKESLKSKEYLYSQGLLSKSSLQDAKNLITRLQSAEATIKSSIARLNEQLAKEYNVGAVEQQTKILDDLVAQREVVELQKQQGYVRSSVSGRVVSMFKDIGNYVQTSERLYVIESASEASHIFYAYVNINEGKKIKLGTVAQIDVSTVRKDEYGSILGRVTQVSQYAVSADAVMNVIRNKGLVAYLMGGSSAMTEVRIQPSLNPDSPSGFLWTSGLGPNKKITTGTVGMMQAIIEDIRPLYYIIPVWRLRQAYWTTSEYLEAQEGWIKDENE
jgi:HlyD family secretion protein